MKPTLCWISPKLAGLETLLKSKNSWGGLSLEMVDWTELKSDLILSKLNLSETLLNCYNKTHVSIKTFIVIVIEHISIIEYIQLSLNSWPFYLVDVTVKDVIKNDVYSDIFFFFCSGYVKSRWKFFLFFFLPLISFFLECACISCLFRCLWFTCIKNEPQ